MNVCGTRGVFLTLNIQHSTLNYLRPMAVNIGDKVSFLNENLKGEVTSIKAGGMIGVTVEDGFEIDVTVREVVVTDAVVGAAPVMAREEMALPSQVDAKAGMYWMLTETPAGYELKILNNLVYPVLFTCYRKNLTAIELQASGRLEPGAMQNITASKSKELSRMGSFSAQYLPLRQFPSQIPQPMSATFESADMQPVNISGKTGENPFYLFAMHAQKSQPAAPQQPESKPVQLNNISKPTEVLDLHAEALGLGELPGDEILKKQMEYFHRHLELGLAYDMPRLIFIHGSGKGVLKNLITLALKGNKNVAGIKEADEREFGYGAIEIKLKN